MNKAVKSGTVADRLRKIFIKYGVNIGASILRSSYVSYRFDEADGRLNMTNIEEMGRKMRTSSRYILTSYRKITNNKRKREDDDIKEEEIKKEDDNDDNKNITIIKEDPYKIKNDKLVKKYNEDVEYKIRVLNQQSEYRKSLGKIEVQRKKVIALLRRSLSYRNSVKPETLLKYNIVINVYI